MSRSKVGRYFQDGDSYYYCTGEYEYSLHFHEISFSHDEVRFSDYCIEDRKYFESEFIEISKEEYEEVKRKLINIIERGAIADD